ncbi:glycosyltransferase family 2 protein [Candidatus Methanodesulfokora washburnensis]|jgi:hypothetical protein|uniref:Glycosyltransferase family 2 protein n=2 Tax=Candidatus Methanodesulfokora washburnensis TaxID=2478471 RepID=A0A429GNE9_9CREN|nr:glycosyltransferase family 2 protein [Candidatus Methanodesulfokores washburnensis]
MAAGEHNHTLIPIIIPTYNSARTLSRCLKSIENQTLKSYEVMIIINGLSKDETKSIALKWIELNPSHRYIGVGAARALYKHGSCSDLFNKYFSSGSQEKARLISKYRLLIDRARRDLQTLLPLMFLIPPKAVVMRIGFYLHRVKPL